MKTTRCYELPMRMIAVLLVCLFVSLAPWVLYVMYPLPLYEDTQVFLGPYLAGGGVSWFYHDYVSLFPRLVALFGIEFLPVEFIPYFYVIISLFVILSTFLFVWYFFEKYGELTRPRAMLLTVIVYLFFITFHKIYFISITYSIWPLSLMALLASIAFYFEVSQSKRILYSFLILLGITSNPTAIVSLFAVALKPIKSRKTRDVVYFFLLLVLSVIYLKLFTNAENRVGYFSYFYNNLFEIMRLFNNRVLFSAIFPGVKPDNVYVYAGGLLALIYCSYFGMRMHLRNGNGNQLILLLMAFSILTFVIFIFSGRYSNMDTGLLYQNLGGNRYFLLPALSLCLVYVYTILRDATQLRAMLIMVLVAANYLWLAIDNSNYRFYDKHRQTNSEKYIELLTKYSGNREGGQCQPVTLAGYWGDKEFLADDCRHQ